MFKQSRANKHLLFDNFSDLSIVDSSAQIIGLYGKSCIGSDAYINRVPCTDNGLLRFGTMVGVEPQAVKGYCLFFYFHFIRNVMIRSSCR